MWNEPRNWKWMIPSALTVVFVVAWGETWATWGGWSNVWIGLAVVCGIAGAMNLWVYAYNHVGNVVADIARARNETPEVRIAEAMRQMPAEAVAYFSARQRIVWRYKYLPKGEMVDYVMDDVPSVHMAMVAFLLEHSSERSVVPMSLFSDGAYTFDPGRQVTDRQQYNDFLVWMRAHGMVTLPFGNQAAQWLPPYGPALLRRRFGMDDGDAVVAEEGALGVVEERVEEWKERTTKVAKAPKVKDKPIPELTAEEVSAHEIVRREYDALHGKK